MEVLSVAARREKIEAELAAARDEKHGFHPLPWKDEMEAFPVIKLDLNAVVLNTHSHRIQSQIISHDRGEEILADPFSGWAQDTVAAILRESNNFDALKKNLASETQREPGVITRNGVLVNANRRATALRDLGQQYIRVAVLPGDPSSVELDDLELKLQMQEDYKESYTLTNQLLFIQDLQNDRGYPHERIAAMMREKEEEVQRLTRILSLVEEARAMSEVDGKPQVPLTYFDDRVLGLTELDQDYQAKKKDDPEAATRLRTMRLVGILAGAKYKTLRQLDDRFFADYFREPWEEAAQNNSELPSFEALAGGAGEDEGDDGLGLEVLGGAADGDGADPLPFLRLIAQTHGQNTVRIPSADGNDEREISRAELLKYTSTVLEASAEEAKFDKTLQNRLEKPAERLRLAYGHLCKVIADMKRVEKHPDFDEAEFLKRYGEVSRSVREIEEYVKHLASSSDANRDA